MKRCWVCGEESVFTDEFSTSWCQEHVDIWKKAWEETE